MTGAPLILTTDDIGRVTVAVAIARPLHENVARCAPEFHPLTAAHIEKKRGVRIAGRARRANHLVRVSPKFVPQAKPLEGVCSGARFRYALRTYNSMSAKYLCGLMSDKRWPRPRRILFLPQHSHPMRFAITDVNGSIRIDKNAVQAGHRAL